MRSKNMVKFSINNKCVIVADYYQPFPSKNLSHSKNALILYFLTLSETVMEVILREYLQFHCPADFDALYKFKTFAFQVHFVHFVNKDAYIDKKNRRRSELYLIENTEEIGNIETLITTMKIRRNSEDYYSRTYTFMYTNASFTGNTIKKYIIFKTV